jgi:hypothetical protein
VIVCVLAGLRVPVGDSSFVPTGNKVGGFEIPQADNASPRDAVLLSLRKSRLEYDFDRDIVVLLLAAIQLANWVCQVGEPALLSTSRFSLGRSGRPFSSAPVMKSTCVPSLRL